MEIHNFAKEINVLELIICIDTGKTARCYKNMTFFQNLNDELEYVWNSKLFNMLSLMCEIKSKLLIEIFFLLYFWVSLLDYSSEYVTLD